MGGIEPSRSACVYEPAFYNWPEKKFSGSVCLNQVGPYICARFRKAEGQAQRSPIDDKNFVVSTQSLALRNEARKR